MISLDICFFRPGIAIFFTAEDSTQILGFECGGVFLVFQGDSENGAPLPCHVVVDFVEGWPAQKADA